MRILLGIALAAVLATARTRAQQVIPLWPGAPPGSESWNYPEQVITRPEDAVRRISNVTRPTLTIYLPEASRASGTGVIVCPGGGFRWLSIDNEGVYVAQWLNSIGLAAFVLKYRVMRTGDGEESNAAKMAERRKTIVPLATADAQQALRLARAHAPEWGVGRDRIGIMGFSAGGYLAAALALHHDADTRPNFAAPVYPGTPEDVTAPADAPPLFLVQADDDKTVAPAAHALRLYQAWAQAGIPAELHIYSRGGHGFGMRKRGLPVDSWTERFRDWLALEGLLNRPAASPAAK